MNFPSPVYQFVWDLRRAVPIPSFAARTLRRRGGARCTYGDHLRAVRKVHPDAPGLVVLEEDVAVPLAAWWELAARVRHLPRAVSTVPYLLYPASTGRALPLWSVRPAGGAGDSYAAAEGAEPCLRPRWFGLGCTYLPGRLLDALPADLRHWDYPTLDTRISDMAADMGVSAWTTPTAAVHLHWE